MVTNGHLLERDVELRLALVAAPDGRQGNPRIMAEHTSVSNDLVARRPREEETRLSPGKTPKSVIYARMSVLFDRSQAGECCEESADIAKIMDVLGRGLQRASPETLF